MSRTEGSAKPKWLNQVLSKRGRSLFSSLSLSSPSNYFRTITFWGCLPRFLASLSITTIFLGSRFKYARSLIYLPFDQTILSLPKAPMNIDCLGSRYSTAVVKNIKSSSEKITTSYFWESLLRKLLRPGLLFRVIPFPKTKSVLSKVPERFRTRVLACIEGWIGSGKNFLTGGSTKN